MAKLKPTSKKKAETSNFLAEQLKRTLLVPRGTIVREATDMDDLLEAQAEAYNAYLYAKGAVNGHKAFLKSELEKG